jgi:predicted dehydrogenase
LYNFKYKKKIFLEKPISTNYKLSKKIYDFYKKKNIKSEINLTYLNHKLFNKLGKIIKSKFLGRVLEYDIHWSFLSYDYFNNISSWKTNEEHGGGIKNIFLTHVLSYCEYLFGVCKIKRFKTVKSDTLIKNYKKKITLDIENKLNISGKIKIYIKKSGTQDHSIKVFFQQGYVLLFTKSKDWTMNFVLKIFKNNQKKNYKLIKDFKYNDGRCYQLEDAIRKFLKPGFKNNLEYCLNAEKNIKKII